MPKLEEDDHLQWVGLANGKLTVKSIYAYQIERREGRELKVGYHKLWKKLWKANILPKWEIFVWKLLNKALPTKRGLGEKKANRE